jgi:hypothetical protein
MNNAWTERTYALYRAALGAYLTVHFAQLLPWAMELFSSDGVLPAQASPLLRAFPNVLALCDAPWAVTGFVAAGVLLAMALLAGWWDRLAALFLWYVWACLFGRNPLIANPGLPYVGLLLLVHAALPRRPGPSEKTRWSVPPALFGAVWVLMALGYSYSGYTKLLSPSWVDGSALAAVLDGPLARPGWLRAALLALPAPVLRVCTWGTLALELLFAPLTLWRRARPLLWAALLAMHVSLIVLLDFADLSLGMVMLHLFTFDPAWVPALRPGRSDTWEGGGPCARRGVRGPRAAGAGGRRERWRPRPVCCAHRWCRRAARRSCGRWPGQCRSPHTGRGRAGAGRR